MVLVKFCLPLLIDHLRFFTSNARVTHYLLDQLRVEEDQKQQHQIHTHTHIHIIHPSNHDNRVQLYLTTYKSPLSFHVRRTDF